jgi:hypothetical protein
MLTEDQITMLLTKALDAHEAVRVANNTLRQAQRPVERPLNATPAGHVAWLAHREAQAQQVKAAEAQLAEAENARFVALEDCRADGLAGYWFTVTCRHICQSERTRRNDP